MLASFTLWAPTQPTRQSHYKAFVVAIRGSSLHLHGPLPRLCSDLGS
jgi:hypothetical protein